MTMTMDKDLKSPAAACSPGWAACRSASRSAPTARSLFSRGAGHTTGDAKPFNAWVRIAPNGTITILQRRRRNGPGLDDHLPMIVAEEMDADWSKVAIEMAPADAAVYGYMFNNNQRMMAIVGSRATHAVLQRSAHRRRAGAQGAAAERRREAGASMPRRCAPSRASSSIRRTASG